MRPFSRATVFVPTLLTLVCLSVLTGCGSDSATGPSPQPYRPPYQTEERTGTLELGAGTELNPAGLRVYSFADSADVDSNGALAVNAPVAEMPQVLLVTSEATGAPVYLGLYDPATDSTIVSDSSTALALALINPYIFLTGSADRELYLAAVQESEYFLALLESLRNAHADNPETALDYQANPVLYQQIVYLWKDALEALAAGKSGDNIQGLFDPPFIQDLPGTAIQFVSPRFAWYTAGVYPNAGNQMKEVVTLHRKETVLSVQWGWPPIVVTDPQTTDYDLGDGYYRIRVCQGYDFGKIAEINDPMGRATLLNTAQSVVYFVDLVLGFAVVPNFIELPAHLNISAHRANQLSQCIANGDVSGFLVEFAKLVIDNNQAIALWIWGQSGNGAAAHFVGAVGTILKDACTVLKIIGFVNEQFPFFSDIVFAPHEVTYFVTQQAGTIVSSSEDVPPVASFTIYPPAGIIGTIFAFDASGTTDDHDDLAALQFRWDFDGDGTWDSPWSSSPAATHAYTESGAYLPVLEARDTHGLADQINHRLNVGGGQGSASHVKLLRDNIPWYTAGEPVFGIDAQVEVIEAYGYSPGSQGQNTYEIIPSSEFGTMELIPGQDLVIVSNDQAQAFYDNYAANQVRFNNFVYGGGTLLWEACDNGWNAGRMSIAGVILPGNVQASGYIDNYNYIFSPDLPLVAGLPLTMDHNYASHEGFINLPDGTTIYCTDSRGLPTLLEFSFGDGWIIISGQPLEHQYRYVYGNPDVGELLPRIIGYFLGEDFPVTKLSVPVATDEREVISSSLPRNTADR